MFNCDGKAAEHAARGQALEWEDKAQSLVVLYNALAKGEAPVFEGNLDLSCLPLETLPEGLQVGGGLYLYGSAITALPTVLKVRGSLQLNEKITALPDNLHILHYLYMGGSPIQTLPKGLCVGEGLDLRGSQVTDIPDDTEVGGRVTLPDDTICDTVAEARTALRASQKTAPTSSGDGPAGGTQP